MRLPESKAYRNGQTVLTAVLGVLAGILLIVLDTHLLLRVAFIIMGVLTVVTQLPSAVTGLLHLSEKGGKLLFASSAVSVLFGFLMIFWHSALLTVLLGIYMILLPLILILTDRRKGERLKQELPRILLGVVLVLIGPATALDVLFDVVGWGIILLTVIYTVVTLVAAKMRVDRAQTAGNRIFVDSDGDGTVDTVYVDTTGDGKADTATDYRENKS